ncbi:peptide chain release factor 2 [Rosa chinensis]|uniref:peptide chain release factor 2 n=1 Tax=Rosa chinensis TaxID=74649 RepID=UPI000D087EA3|nr:peptide chain release factor 2 [Rosa chinensis]
MRKHSKRKTQQSLHTHCAHDMNRFYKQLGLFSLKKKIEDDVLRAEMLAPLALELEEERRNEQEQLIRNYDLWDDTAESNEVLAKLADSVRVVDALRDLTYKVSVKQRLSMYTKWARKLGYKGRVVEMHSSTNGGIKSATIEFSFGCLSGEAGVHYIINSKNGSAVHEEAVKGQLWSLRDPQGKPLGVMGWWPSRAVINIFKMVDLAVGKDDIAKVRGQSVYMQ